MGTRLDELRIGSACACHSVPGGTPSHVYVLFGAVNGCPGKPEPPNGVTYTCRQDSVNSCLFVSGADMYGRVARVNFLCALNQISVSLFAPPNDSDFFQVIGLPIAEYDFLINSQVACGAGNSATGGVAIVFWLEKVFDLVDILDLPTDGNGLFLESFLVTLSQIVHRFANTSYGLNKMVKISI